MTANWHFTIKYKAKFLFPTFLLLKIKNITELLF